MPTPQVMTGQADDSLSGDLQEEFTQEARLSDCGNNSTGDNYDGGHYGTYRIIVPPKQQGQGVTTAPQWN